MSNYIKKIEIQSLWGEYSLCWNLNQDVNILSGMNGSGKSTVIRSLVMQGCRPMVGEVKITFENGESTDCLNCKNNKDIKVDAISTFDNRFKDADAVKSLSDGDVKTELDWEIYRLQKRYVSYQLEQSRQIIKLLSNQSPQGDIDAITSHKELFYNIMDQLFVGTGKKIDRTADELLFTSKYGVITPYMLSSGEKQVLIILTTVLTQSNSPAILFMDEPEISLHFDWQSRLISDIRALNPNVQLIISTHSPALIMNGWMGHTSEINDLIV